MEFIMSAALTLTKTINRKPNYTQGARLEKDKARLEVAQRVEPKKSILDLCGREATSIDVLSQNKIIDQNTILWCIEKCKTYKLEIISRLNEIFGLHIQSQNHNVIIAKLEDFILLRPIDFLNADTENSFSQKLMLWLSQIPGKMLLKKCDVVLTTVTYTRGKNPWRDCLQENWHLMPQISHYIVDLQNEFRVTTHSADGLKWGIVDLFLLLCCLNKYDLSVFKPILYNDTTYVMVVNHVRIDRLLCKRKYPAISSIFHLCLKSLDCQKWLVDNK